MKINDSCGFFLRDIYLYDISACHYSILDGLGIDVSHLDRDDKEKRNTQIGLMMRENPSLISLLRGITESTIDEYLLRNHIKDDDLIIRQYDGIIVKKRLSETTDRYLPITLQKTFDNFIISIDRNSYIAYDGRGVVIKGIPHRYPEIDNIYKKIVKLNYSSKISIFKGMQRIKEELLFSKGTVLFGIPTGDAEKFNVFLKQFGELEVSKSMLKLMDSNDIDKQRYFDHYIRPFTESLSMEFL